MTITSQANGMYKAHLTSIDILIYVPARAMSQTSQPRTHGTCVRTTRITSSPFSGNKLALPGARPNIMSSQRHRVRRLGNCFTGR
ncbi:hypothetical protein C1H76_2131 [Elsinoe australis]|uniref:Uncharacterized protein n=1 Tax=Elsinoe australis TaxID=40998 RepID=A0A4U7B753_9PEZI|nr:hypothetical protein C1H76_2131 [Elsinoe australis]